MSGTKAALLGEGDLCVPRDVSPTCAATGGPNASAPGACRDEGA